MFLDHIYLVIQSGSGGNGCESYYHRTDKKSIPEGGDGGDGGSVIIRADSNAAPLSSFRYRLHQTAESGDHGGPTKKRGRNGQDLYLTVPVGTRIIDREKKYLIRELLKAGEQVVIVEGGKGGVGNAGGKTLSLGERGSVLEIELTIKIQADVFLVGLPNSGKSSLLNALTRAHVKEESYPFATISPEIAVYQKSNYESLTLCELPSLYESSHEGRGRGNDFLKHLEDAKQIFFVLSIDSQFGGTLLEQWNILKKQLQLFNPKILEAPAAFVVNKIDLETSSKGVKLPAALKKHKVFLVSAKTGQGMQEVTGFLNKKIDLAWKHELSAKKDDV